HALGEHRRRPGDRRGHELARRDPEVRRQRGYDRLGAAFYRHLVPAPLESPARTTYRWPLCQVPAPLPDRRAPASTQGPSETPEPDPRPPDPPQPSTADPPQQPPPSRGPL